MVIMDGNYNGYMDGIWFINIKKNINIDEVMGCNGYMDGNYGMIYGWSAEFGSDTNPAHASR